MWVDASIRWWKVHHPSALSATRSAFHRPGRSRWSNTLGPWIRGGPETATDDLDPAHTDGDTDGDALGTNDAHASPSWWRANANPAPAHTTVAAAATAI